MAKRNSLESATLSLNLFRGIYPQFLFFGGGELETSRSITTPFSPLSSCSFTHLLFVRHKADYTFQRRYSSKNGEEKKRTPWKVSLSGIYAYLSDSVADNLKGQSDIFWEMSSNRFLVKS